MKNQFDPIKPDLFCHVNPLPDPRRILPETVFWTDRQMLQWRLQLRVALNKERFIAWLQSFPPDAVAGYARKPQSDPLAQYLAAVLPWLDCEVGAAEIWISLSNLNVANREITMLQHNATDDRLRGYPEWVRTFVQTVDRVFSEGFSPDREWIVTAAEALEVMRRIHPVT